jgi:glucuronosyltransferase
MVLLNSHLNQGNIRPFVPAMIEIGGLQIKPNPDPLPKGSSTIFKNFN